MTAGSTPWRDGRHVDPAEALRLVRDRFPALAAGQAVPLGTGWDNTALLVDGTWLARFPRRQQGADLTARELAVLPRLAGVLPLAVPAPELVGAPGPDFPWRFTLARVVRGHEWWLGPPPTARLVAAARLLGRTLGLLHSPRTAARLGDALADLPVDPNRRAEPVERVRRTLPALARLTAGGLLAPPLDRASLVALAEQAERPARGPLVLCHGDLHLRHVLVHDGGPSGLIDWGDVCRAEASVDLQAAFALVEGEARRALLDAYAEVGPALTPGVLARARVLAATLALLVADAAHDTGDEPLLHASLDAAARALRG